MTSRDPNFVRILCKSQRSLIIENSSSPLWIIDRASSIFQNSRRGYNYGIAVLNNSYKRKRRN